MIKLVLVLAHQVKVVLVQQVLFYQVIKITRMHLLLHKILHTMSIILISNIIQR